MEKEHVWELLKKVSLPVFFFAILIILTFFQYSVSDTQKIAELLSKPLLFLCYLYLGYTLQLSNSQLKCLHKIIPFMA